MLIWANIMADKYFFSRLHLSMLRLGDIEKPYTDNLSRKGEHNVNV